MQVSEVLARATDGIAVKRVFGEPLEKDGTTFIPAARVMGGGGGGTGTDTEGQQGEGGGFGLSGRPAGAYVIRNGEARWQPAVDPNQVVAVLGLVLVAYLVTRPRMVRARARAASGAA